MEGRMRAKRAKRERKREGGGRGMKNKCKTGEGDNVKKSETSRWSCL